MDRGPSINFRLDSMQPGDLPSTSVNFPCGRYTLLQISVRPGDFQLPSTFHAAGRPSVNFLCSQGNFCQLPSTFYVVGRCCANVALLSTFPAADTLSVNFRHVSMQLEDLLSISSTFYVARRPSINFLCGRERSVNFCQLSMWPGYRPLPSNFRVVK